MTRFLKGTDRPLAEAYQLALLDLDGVGLKSTWLSHDWAVFG